MSSAGAHFRQEKRDGPCEYQGAVVRGLDGFYLLHGSFRCGYHLEPVHIGCTPAPAEWRCISPRALGRTYLLKPQVRATRVMRVNRVRFLQQLEKSEPEGMLLGRGTKGIRRWMDRMGYSHTDRLVTHITVAGLAALRRAEAEHTRHGRHVAPAQSWDLFRLVKIEDGS